ncbi:unnamed protein product [marine sediment metagenome]|uniref:Uncharacterized protein n=1 Tax=marine sediment metagenome TaxID=412755 RepID=X1K8T9_9ZZZZ
MTLRNNLPSTSWTKLKEILLNAGLIACRIKFSISNEPSYVGHGRIYKNGSPIGKDQTAVNGYATKSEDFSGFVAGDLIQLYAKQMQPGKYVKVKNLRFYYSLSITEFGSDALDTPLPITTDPTISTTNQDP